MILANGRFDQMQPDHIDKQWVAEYNLDQLVRPSGLKHGESMPRPRFDRLPAEKREMILEAAAKEFAAYGYAQASLNRILNEAGISKGAAYYYFDDKADLYMTAVTHYSQQIMQTVAFDVETLTSETFWPTLTELYRRQFNDYQERPWVLGLAKSGGPMTQAEMLSGPLAEFWQEMQQTIKYLVQKGQELGVIRSDLELELLVSLLVAVDDAHDNWLFVESATAVDPAAAAERMISLLRRLLSPE